MRFSDKLSKQRKNNNMSQEQLADKLGVSRQAVSKWESGSSYPDMDKIIQICNILNCTLEDLLDDGVIKENKSNKEVKNNFNNYLQDFLTFITKSYNMFYSMTLKEKLKFIFEMIILIVFVFILGTIVAAILNTLTHNILSIMPDVIHYYLYNLIETIYITALFILGTIIVIHLFKIRYLDYFITIEDKNVTEKTIEQPIEKRKYIEKDKEKIIIRDPKHSTFSFINFLGKLILYIIKLFSLIIIVPTILFFIDFVFLSIMSLCHISYGMIFIYIFITIIGLILISYIIIEFIYNFIFDIKQKLNKLFIIFITSLILIGIGSSLTIFTILNYQENDKINENTKTEYIDIDQNTSIYFNTYENNIEYIIDNSYDKAKLEITYPEEFEYIIDYNETEYEEERLQKYYHIYIQNINPFKVYKLIVNDIKNKQIPIYDSYNLLKYKVYLNEQDYNYLNKNY